MKISNMHRSNQPFFIKSILICLLLVHKSYEFNIPDQHLTLGKFLFIFVVCIDLHIKLYRL